MSSIKWGSVLCIALGASVIAPCIAADTTISDNVIKIGILNDRSGAYADLGGEGSVVAARMAAEEFGNAIDGVPIEIVSADHQNKPDVGLGIVRRWFDTEKVDVVADISNSGVGFAITTDIAALRLRFGRNHAPQFRAPARNLAAGLSHAVQFVSGGG